MFKFNFNVAQNDGSENSNVKEEDDACLSNQEFGYFYINDLQSKEKQDNFFEIKN